MRHFWLLVAVCLLGAGLRFHALTQDVRFHADEAFFTAFAQQAVTQGDWMLPGPLDKSPLSIYASALSLHFVAAYENSLGVIDVDTRQGEFAARVPNTLAGIVIVALTAAVTRHIAGPAAALLAALLAACSPYLISFSPSAFTDVWMLALMLATLLATLRGRPGWAGALLALSIAAKQQGIFYLPLLWVLLRPRDWWRFGLALTVGVLLLFCWDALRPATSIFAVAAQNNAPGRLFAAPGEIIPRLRVWLGYAGWMLSAPSVTVGLVTVAGVALLWSRRKHPCIRRDEPPGRPYVANIIALYTLAYLIAHVIVAFNTYDRYLLPVVPQVIVLVALGVSRLSVQRGWVGVGLAVLLLPTALQSSALGIDLGRDHTPLDRPGEIIALAEHLNAKPTGTIVYNPWLGWEMGYYMGAWMDKRRVYYPSPAVLLRDATANPEAAPRYLIAPTSADLIPWVTGLREAGFRVRVDYQTPRYIAFRLLHPLAVSGV
jgi:4-amino-4-deoxy-L-arabinose transferase-like glycosyltransferase